MEPPDRLEKGIRFGCGFLFGCLGVLASSFVYTITNGHYLAAICLGFGILFGFLAMRLGDEFWFNIFPWWPW